MLNQATIERIERFWAARFGCAVARLRSAGVKVLPSEERAKAWVFRYGDSCIWHVPAGMVEHVAAALRIVGPAAVTPAGVTPPDGADADMTAVDTAPAGDVLPPGRVTTQDAFSPGTIRAVLGAAPGAALSRLLGPCPIAYCDEETFRSAGAEARLAPGLLGREDRAAVEVLAAGCGQEAWDHGGVELDAQEAVFGCFVGSELVAAASYKVWDGVIAHVGVVTHPAWRGRGYGRAVAAAATQHAISDGLVAQWRTLASNLPSVAVGTAIGYETVAEHFLVALAGR